MHLYLNDASLQGQFAGNSDQLLNVLKRLIAIKSSFIDSGCEFYVSSKFRETYAYEDVSVQQLVFGLKSKERQSLKISILQWLDKARPPKDNLIYQSQGANLKYRNLNVTGTAIALAIEDIIHGMDCPLYSFQNGKVCFEITPLHIDRKLPGSAVKKYQIDNFWELDELENKLKSIKPRNSWDDLRKIVKSELLNIEFRDEIFFTLKNQPFDDVIFKELYRRLRTLNQYVENRQNGIESKEATRIRNDEIQGSPYFSDENAKDKTKFANELNFKRIDGRKQQNEKWHGKIKKNQFRVYFEWPLEKKRKKLEVFYVGPKITKR